MVDEKANNGARGGQGGRRRYFRRRAQNERGGQNQNAPPSKEPQVRQSTPEKGSASARQGRLGRRRRRSSSRVNDTTKTTPAAAESILELDDYVPPQNVFVYTHISRPGSRDSYEFRSEHFSKIGRRLEDYHIDLSSLITESGEIRLTSIAPVPLPEEVEDIEPDSEADL
jgi:hypothetical protein